MARTKPVTRKSILLSKINEYKEKIKKLEMQVRVARLEVREIQAKDKAKMLQRRRERKEKKEKAKKLALIMKNNSGRVDPTC
jgi:hypothetical protein